MNIYQSIGSHLGTPEAADLAERLASWHDAMVGHERQQKEAVCDEDCPHSHAGGLWDEAVQTFGQRAKELQFLRSRGSSRPGGGQRARRGAAAEARA